MVEIGHLRPTQFVVGLKEVEVRKKLILEQESFSQGTPHALYKDKVGKIVVGPNNLFYLIDGHHLARALYELNYKEMYVIVKHDWSNFDDKKFWKKMSAPKNAFSYLFNEKEEPLSYKTLPSSIGDLKDDPYRSLAWYVRKAGGFKNLNTPFQEFIWARIFRGKYPGLTNDTKVFLDTAEKAIKFSQSKEARNLALPGVLMKKKRKLSCRQILNNVILLLPD